MWRVLRSILMFVLVLAAIMAALLIYDFYKHGLDYYGSALFNYDMNFDVRIALTAAVIIFLVDVCYQATFKTLRMGAGPNRNDVN